MAGNAQVVVEFLARTQGLTSGLKDVSAATSDANKHMGKLDFKSLAKWAGGIAAAAGAAKLIKDATSQTVDFAKASAQMSRTTGLDTKTSSEWIEVLKSRGIQSSQFNKSMVTLSKQMTNAAGGGKKSTEMFDKLGVSMADVAKGDTGKVLMEAADGLSKLQSPAERAAYAQQLLGRSGQALIPLLVQGSKGIQDQLDIADKYGATVSDKTAGQVGDLVQQQRELKMAGDGLKIQLGTALIPVLGELVGAFADVVKVLQPIISNKDVLLGVIAALTAAWATYKATMVVVEIAEGIFNATLTATQILITGGIILAIIALIAIGIALYKHWDDIKDAAEKVWGMIKDAVSAVFEWAKDHWPLLLGILLGPFGLAVGIIVQYWDQIRGGIVTALNTIKGVISSAWSAVQSGVTAAWNAIKTVITGVWDAIKKAVTDAVNSVKDVVGGVWGTIAAAITNAAKTVGDAAGKVGQAIYDAVIKPLLTIGDKVRSTVNTAITFGSEILNAIGGKAADIGQKIVSSVVNVVENIGDRVRGAINSALTFGEDLLSAIQGRSGKIGNRIIQAIVDVLAGIGAAVRQTIMGALDFGEEFLQGVRNKMAKVVGAIKSPLNAVIDAWNDLRIPGFNVKINMPGPIPDINFGWDGMGLPNIPRLAGGGILEQPTLFLGGEAGREIVSPESLLRQIVGEQTPEVHVYIGDVELKGLVRTVVVTENNRTAQTLLAGLT